MLVSKYDCAGSAALLVSEAEPPLSKERNPIKARRRRSPCWLQTGAKALNNVIHPPKHNAAFVQSAARALLAAGHDEAAVFGNTAFDASLLASDLPIAVFEDSLRFLEQASLLSGDDLFGHNCGLTQDARSCGMIYYAAQTARTLAEAVAQAQRYSRLFNSLLEFDADSLRSDGVLKWSYRISPSLPRRQYVELAAATKYRAMNYFIQQNVNLKQVRFQHLRRQNGQVLEKLYGCEVVFGARDNALVIETSDLDIPLKTSDRQLARVLQQYGDQALSFSRQDVPPLVLEVERIIADHLAEGQATLENVAQALGMSARTLSRKLSQENTTFFRILEDLRKSQAVLYLGDSDMVLAEIAFLLGYSGLSSFNDAFKRWTGMSPGQFRTQRASPA